MLLKDWTLNLIRNYQKLPQPVHHQYVNVLKENIFGGMGISRPDRHNFVDRNGANKREG